MASRHTSTVFVQCLLRFFWWLRHLFMYCRRIMNTRGTQRRKVVASTVFRWLMFSSLRLLTVWDLFKVLKSCYRCPLHPFLAASIRRYATCRLAQHSSQSLSVTWGLFIKLYYVALCLVEGCSEICLEDWCWRCIQLVSVRYIICNTG